MRKRAGAGTGRLEFIEPLMPTLVEEPPEGGGAWIHGEVRRLPVRDRHRRDTVRILTRRGLDWTAKYGDLADAAKSLSMQNAIIDGGRSDDARLSDFAALRKAITKRQHDQSSPFDLPHLNGHDLRDMPLEDRREILASMIPPDIRIQFSQALPVEAKSIFHLVDQAGLQGMVSKRKDSRYRGGPSTNWLKTKALTVDEYDLLGVEPEASKPAFALTAERGTGRYVGSAFIT